MIAQLIQSHISFFILAMAAFLPVILLWNLAMQIRLSRIKKQNETFFSGTKAKKLEEIILEQASGLKTLDKDIQELYNISNQINALAFKSLHKTGLVRFNPFKEIGGDQSFSIALLNGKNNGLVLSSLHTREGTRIYSKTITGGKSEKHPLAKEEERAIKIALAGETKKIN